jgi:hypothetical protein
LLGPLK